MIYGIGTDIIEIKRIAASITRYEQRFLDKIFTSREQEYCHRHQQSAQHFAGRFAAKEAIVKAIGTGFRRGVSWLDIEIINDSDGKPEVILSEKLREMVSPSNNNVSIQLTMSHCREYAVAFAVATSNN